MDQNIVNMYECIKNVYTLNFKELNFSGYINPLKKQKIINKMKHCKLVMQRFASQNPDTVSFNKTQINCTNEQFLTFWNANKHNTLYTVDFTPVMD